MNVGSTRRPESVNELRHQLLALSLIQGKNQRPTLRAVPICDFASRRKLHPHHSQYLASRIFAPRGTVWTHIHAVPASVRADPSGLVLPRYEGAVSRVAFRDPKYFALTMTGHLLPHTSAAPGRMDRLGRWQGLHEYVSHTVPSCEDSGCQVLRMVRVQLFFAKRSPQIGTARSVGR